MFNNLSLRDEEDDGHGGAGKMKNVKYQKPVKESGGEKHSD